MYVHDIDDLLGPKEGRFFGDGFKRVDHTLSNISFEFHQVGDDPFLGKGQISAKGNLIYPDDWSIKSNHFVRPHLSTIDAIVFGSEIAESYLSNIFEFRDIDLSSSLIEKCQISAGSEPIENLENFKITGTYQNKKYSSKVVSAFKLLVGNLKISLTISHLILGNQVNSEINLGVLRGDVQNYNSLGYRNTDYYLQNVNIQDDKIEYETRINRKTPTRGLEANYFPFVTFIDAVILSGQISQAFLYHLDDISRNESNTLWMRKVSITRDKLLNHDTSFVGLTILNRSQIIKMGDSIYRSAIMTGKFSDVTIKYSVAHDISCKLK